MNGLTIIDMHTHIWRGRYEADEKLLLQAIERYELRRIYVSALGGYTPDEETVDDLNAHTAAFVKSHPEHVSGYVYVSPEHQNALDVLRRGIEQQGLSGLKLWVSTYCDEPCVFPLIEYCESHGLPVLVHSFHKANGQVASETVGKNVANLARRYPKAKLIMAHLGGNCYNGVPAIRDCKNVWCDYCGSIFRGDELNYAVEQLGVDRILYGTDMPGSFVVNIGQVLEADLTAAERDKILYLNTEKLFDRSFRL
ncbi:MAG: amidohydrolase family protein [Clostridiaceae bacterium]|nr:amidohydrolase family protein [Clostridiaceae bacterium]